MAENSPTTRTHSRRENADTRDPHSVIAREGGRSSIAEELMINREAAAYWIPAFAGMTAGGGCKSGRLRRRAQANVTRRVIAREGGRSSIAEELMINREAAAYWIPAFAGRTAGATTNPSRLRMRAQANVPRRHRPRRRAIQYCRGADDQSTGRGVLDTRFRGYDDWAGLQKRPFAHASAGECHARCHRPRRRAIQYCRGADDQSRAAAYWIPAFAGMTAGRGCKSGRLRMRAQRMSRAVSSPAKAGDPVLQRS